MTTTARPTRKGRKFEQVIEGARAVFLEDGFSSASVDDIARAAGVSKATLYSYFPDKKLLFIEVARRECRRLANEAVNLAPLDLPVRAFLKVAAQKMVDHHASPLHVAIYRIVLSEADRFPDLAREFYENGPLIAHRLIAARLGAADSSGELTIHDAELAADQFVELCRAGFFSRLVHGLTQEVSAETRRRVAREAVETFLARYDGHDRRDSQLPQHRFRSVGSR